MGTSSDSNPLTRFIKLGCILAFILVSVTSFARYVFDVRDRNRCSSLLNEGWWLKNEQWQPASCMMHNYKAPDLSQCLEHSRIVYVGDSIIRQQYFAAAKLIRPNIDTDGEPHVNRKFVFQQENLVLEFYWDPYLNESVFQEQLQRPSLMVIGGGAWHMHYLGDDYFEKWQKSIDTIFDKVSMDLDLADTIVMNPVEVPNYDKLSSSRVNTMTLKKITKMNDYLKEKEEQLGTNTKTPLGVAFVYNEISSQTTQTNVTEDGLHYSPFVTNVQNQIAFNFRCNGQLNTHFPMDTTCCYKYPSPTWYQLAFIFFYLIYVPAGFLIHNGLVSSNSALLRLFPDKKVLHASFVFGLGVLYMYYSDRTQLFGKIHKQFNATIFTGMMIAVAVLGMIKLQTKAEGDLGFLNRHQTDEWKGWMQVIILVYHFCGASGTSGIYNAVRILVAAYLFQTGYGHFFFFYKKADFGLKRVLNVMVRLNFLTFVLQYLMDTDYLSYYFTPLVSFWFIVIWVTMYVGHPLNKNSWFIIAKIIAACAVTTALIHVPGVLEFLFTVLKFVFAVDWNAAEWRFRLALDAYIVYVGMLCAFGFIKISEHKLMDHPRWPTIKNATLVSSAVAMVWYFFFELTRENKFVYNKSHPFISWIPIMAFVFLRNANLYLRNTHSEFYSFIGKISLETFIGQFHMWLAADTKGLLVILAKPTWVAGFGWWINFFISSCIFILVCHYLSQTTHELSVWVCAYYSNTQNQQSTRGAYQAVPLLPTTSSSQTAEEGQAKEPEVTTQDEEIWDSSMSNEKKPSLLAKLLDDTRVKVALTIVLIALFNHAC